MAKKTLRKKIGNFIRGVAPTLATAIGGPYAGMAVKFVGEKLLDNPEATEDEIEATLTATTFSDFGKLKEMEQEFKTRMRELDIDVYRMEVEDRASARELFRVNIWPQIILSSIFIAGYFAVLFFLFGGKTGVIADAKADWFKGVFTTVLGVLTAAIPQILNFWFGSSLGSKEKTRGMLDRG